MKIQIDIPDELLKITGDTPEVVQGIFIRSLGNRYGPIWIKRIGICLVENWCRTQHPSREMNVQCHLSEGHQGDHQGHAFSGTLHTWRAHNAL